MEVDYVDADDVEAKIDRLLDIEVEYNHELERHEEICLSFIAKAVGASIQFLVHSDKGGIAM